MRCLLIGDAHLHEGPNLDDVATCLAFAVQTARERDVDLAIFLGDQFDRKSTPEERLVLRDVLLAMPCPSILIRGNHDALGDLQVFAGYPNVQVFEQPAVVPGELVGSRCADIVVVPWAEKSWLAAAGWTGEAGDQAGARALAQLIQGLAATRPDPKRPFILVGHLSVGGAVSSSGQPLIGRGLEITLGDLVDAGAVFTGLGHIHLPQELAPSVHYIGSTSIVDFGEEGEEKRIGILDVGADGTYSIAWLPTPCRRWVTINAWVSAEYGPMEQMAGDDNPPVFTGPSAPIMAHWQAEGANVRYTVTCGEEQEHLFDQAALRRRFVDAHTFKVETRITRAERVRAADVAAARSTADKLAAWGAATGTEIAPSLIDKLRQLESEVVP